MTAWVVMASLIAVVAPSPARVAADAEALAQPDCLGRRHRLKSAPPAEPDKPSEEDVYAKGEYGKHIGPETPLKPTPKERKDRKTTDEAPKR